VSTFTVQAFIANPEHPQQRLAIELLVDTGATYTLLPGEVVRSLGLATPWRRTAMLASGEDVTYAMGHVLMRLDGEEMPTIFLAGPPGCQALIGAVTLEEFALGVDPVHRRLVPVSRVLLRRQEHLHGRCDVDPSEHPGRAVTADFLVDASGPAIADVDRLTFTAILRVAAGGGAMVTKIQKWGNSQGA